jgi:putative tryptophan/tyrosine transport system substrate-binding protein
MTTRRQLLIAGLFGVASRSAYGQRTPVKIGMLSTRSLDESLYSKWIVHRLGELGYRDSAKMTLVFRSADSVATRFPALARELVEQKCDLIFTVGSEPAARALRDLRASMPVVMLAADYDPVERGLAVSYSRPGGNFTGVYMPVEGLITKRFELLREVVPAGKSFLIFGDSYSADAVRIITRAADSAGISLTVIEFTKRPYDLEAAFEKGRVAMANGLLVPASPVFAEQVRAIATLAKKYRLPSAGFTRSADMGFLLTYSVDNRKAAAQVAELGVRILQRPGMVDIPLEQPQQFELVINMITAKALDVTMPQSIMARATRIIQ